MYCPGRIPPIIRLFESYDFFKKKLTFFIHPSKSKKTLRPHPRTFSLTHSVLRPFIHSVQFSSVYVSLILEKPDSFHPFYSSNGRDERNVEKEKKSYEL